ncbi:MAG: hypothetical protein KF774_13470 [Planctomyces sp.]|nr:hypothetical protein [Planctomyces sp.]
MEFRISDRLSRGMRDVAPRSGVALVVGVISWCWLTQFVLAWGANHATMTALAAVVATAWIVGDSLRLQFGAVANAPWAWLAPAAWTMVAPALLTAGVDWAGRWGWEALSDSRMVFLASYLGGLAAIGPGLACTFSLAHRGDADLRLRPGFWFQIAALWLLLPITFAAWMDVQSLALLTAAGCVAAFLTRTLRPGTPAAPAADVEVVRRGLAWADAVAIASVAASGGVAFAFIDRIRMNLFLPVASIAFAAWAGLMLGIGCGLAGRPKALPRGARCAAGGLLVLGVALSFHSAAWPWLSHAALMISASVSSLAWIVLLRMAIAASMTLPVGFALGRCLRLGSVRADGGRGIAPAGMTPLLTAVWFTLGLASAVWSGATPQTAWLVGVGLVVASAIVLTAGRGWTALSPLRRGAFGGAAVAGLAAAALCDVSTIPGVSRVLFSGFHFQAYSAGVAPAQLRHLDGARLVEHVASRDADWSVWSVRGESRSLHRNGVPRSITSVDPALCPQPATEVLSAVTPMILHPHPHRILVLSAESPAVAATCLAFPVEQVTILESDPCAARLARMALERIDPRISAGEERLEWCAAPAMLAMASAERDWDLILAPQSPVAEFSAAGLMTVEHYRRVAARLAPEGMFCQRLSCVDLGMDSALTVVRSLQLAFGSVDLCETAPGEWLLLATQAPIEVDESLIARLEKPHVRNVLAEAGWDWSILCGLREVPDAALRRQTESRGASTTGGGRLAFQAPLEVMRWAPKFEERRQWLARHSRALADRLGESSALTDISQRLSDIQLAQQVLTDHPDQYWAYRKWLKKRLQERPRAKVIQVADEGLRNGLHPEDARRKKYLATLGTAVRDGATRSELESLAEFASPFDPLVSPFIDREVAMLERRLGGSEPGNEWRAWIRSVYFAPTTDVSVRNVCDAMRTLCERPDLVADPGARWDHHNALLEQLKARWQSRLAARDRLKYGVADAEHTLSAVTATFAAMDDLRDAAGVPEAEWTTRRALLERQLVRPVRSARSNQSAHEAVLAGKTDADEFRVDGVEQADGESMPAASSPAVPRRLTPEQTAGQPLRRAD